MWRYQTQIRRINTNFKIAVITGVCKGWGGIQEGREEGRERMESRSTKRAPRLIYKILFYFFLNKMIWKTKVCAFWLNPSWSWWMILLMYYWILFAIILFIVFRLVPWSAVLSFFSTIFFKIGFQGCFILIKWTGEFSMLFYNLEPFVKYR